MEKIGLHSKELRNKEFYEWSTPAFSSIPVYLEPGVIEWTLLYESKTLAILRGPNDTLLVIK